jgi:hypothetical protein
LAKVLGKFRIAKLADAKAQQNHEGNQKIHSGVQSIKLWG